MTTCTIGHSNVILFSKKTPNKLTSSNTTQIPKVMNVVPLPRSRMVPCLMDQIFSTRSLVKELTNLLRMNTDSPKRSLLKSTLTASTRLLTSSLSYHSSPGPFTHNNNSPCISKTTTRRSSTWIFTSPLISGRSSNPLFKRTKGHNTFLSILEDTTRLYQEFSPLDLRSLTS